MAQAVLPLQEGRSEAAVYVFMLLISPLQDLFPWAYWNAMVGPLLCACKA